MFHESQFQPLNFFHVEHRNVVKVVYGRTFAIKSLNNVSRI